MTRICRTRIDADFEKNLCKSALFQYLRHLLTKRRDFKKKTNKIVAKLK